jgi:hypothetical protein
MNETTTSEEQTLKLWNPNTAANWSLLLTPIFGAWIQALNWKELNQPDKAKSSMAWVYGYVIFILTSLFINIPPVLGLGVLLGWYFSSAKGQVKYIKENGVSYQKKSWGKPLKIGFSAFVIYVAVVAVILSSSGASTDDLSKIVIKSMKENNQFKAGSIQIKSLTLAKKSGNEYSGILETLEPNGEFTYKVRVIYDGNNTTWELLE